MKKIYPLQAGLIWVQVITTAFSFEEAMRWLMAEGLRIKEKYPQLASMLVLGQAGYETDSIIELEATGWFKAKPYDADVQAILGAA